MNMPFAVIRELFSTLIKMGKALKEKPRIFHLIGLENLKGKFMWPY